MDETGHSARVEAPEVKAALRLQAEFAVLGVSTVIRLGSGVALVIPERGPVVWVQWGRGAWLYRWRADDALGGYAEVSTDTPGTAARRIGYAFGLRAAARCP
ncbi:hypothetical protein [Rhizohabitans arisaemae]|uniref:hypothetical protein n=1 Tax=Rhizohabitans arisaemae TaxID=2720610 RepID=UPI0024B12257|nr:hypothetical protein [Rhizohabitans arisaemae]